MRINYIAAPAVDHQAQRGYDNLGSRQTKAKKLQSKKQRFCEHSHCGMKLSMYNTTKWCSKHQRENIDISQLI
jgi:hypothetical protein